MKRFIFIAITLFFLIAPPAHAEGDGATSLKDTVVTAVKQHPQIKSLLYNREAISNNLAASLGRFFPSLNLSSSYGFQQYNSSAARTNNIQDRTRTASDSTLTMTQPLFDGMDRYNDYQGSKAQLESAENRLFDTVESVALDAIRAHIDIIRERKLTALAEANIIAHQEVLNSIVERVAGGAGSMADEMQARGRVARAETTLITYTGDLKTAEAQYIRVTGMSPGVLEETEFKPEFIPSDLDSVMEEAMDNNPKIKTYKAEVIAKEKDKNVVQSNMYPDVDLKVSSRYTNNLDGAQTYLQDHRAMLALSWNLFKGGSDYNNVKTASDRVKESQENLQDIMDDMTRQVATGWVEYETAVAQIDKHQEALQYSIESRDMYLMQFNVGQRSLLDVLDAINEVFSNNVLYETSLSNKDFTLYKLLALQGNLIKTLEIADKNYEKVPE